MNKTSVLELIFYAVLQRSEKQQLIKKFATQTLDKNFDAILGEVFINPPKKINEQNFSFGIDFLRCFATK